MKQHAVWALVHVGVIFRQGSSVMMQFQGSRRHFMKGLAGTAAALCTGAAVAQQGRQFTEPVYRVAQAPAANQHPLDPALEIAQKALQIIRSSITDYECTIIKRERVKGVLREPEYIYAKIRNGKEVNGQPAANFAVYLNFRKPDSLKGQEALYIANENNGKMIAKKGGLGGKLIPAVWLKPDAPIAMADNLYPITDIGIENLVVKLIERAEREKKVGGGCDVKFMEGAKINGRACTLIQVMHPEKRPEFDFHLAQIFIDKELQIPIRYAAYGWPDREGGTPSVLEEYTYLQLKLNRGYTDADFDPQNPAYNFR